MSGFKDVWVSSSSTLPSRRAKAFLTQWFHDHTEFSWPAALEQWSHLCTADTSSKSGFEVEMNRLNVRNLPFLKTKPDPHKQIQSCAHAINPYRVVSAWQASWAFLGLSDELSDTLQSSCSTSSPAAKLSPKAGRERSRAALEPDWQEGNAVNIARSCRWISSHASLLCWLLLNWMQQRRVKITVLNNVNAAQFRLRVKAC